LISVVGKPIKTSDERAEQIGPTQGMPILVSMRLAPLLMAGRRPSAFIPLGLSGVATRTHQRRHHHAASDRVLLLIARPSAAYPSAVAPILWRGSPWRTRPACFAAPALSADYILTAEGAFPPGWCFGLGQVHPGYHTPFLSDIGILIVISCSHLRGVRRSR